MGYFQETMLATRTKRDQPEFRLQCWFAMWVQSRGLLANASVSAVKVSMFVAKKMKSAGYRKGFPDFQILVARGGYHGLFIEIKSEEGRASVDQLEWQRALTQEGYKALIMPALPYAQAQQWLIDEVEKYLQEPVRSWH